MEKVITFDKTDYDPFLDFIKAYAIICVLMGHTFPYLDETGYSLWYGMQVPLFILVQVFHSFKKESPRFQIRKCIERVFVPFVLVQAVLFLIIAEYSTCDYKMLIINTIQGGGNGPGSYFPWLYIQIAILLPWLRPLFNHGTRAQHTVTAIIVCELFEILTSYSGMPDYLYRLLALRYIFLIYLGWLWVKDDIVINKKTIVLSLFSMGAIVYFEYFYTNTEPWFYDTAWKTHRWPCYFYVSNLLCYILYILYNKTKQYIDKPVKVLAKCSYEIFLVQMAVIPLFPQLSFIGNSYLQLGIRTTCIFAISVIGGYYFNIIYNNTLQKIKA